MLSAGEVIDDRFELIELAGSGGMGAVFRAFDRTTGRTVALKVLAHGNPDRPRFAREVRHLATMSDPRIVRLIADGNLADDQPYLVMEWVEGESLQHLLESRGLTVAEAVMVGQQIAGALGVLHEHGLVHRDVKPSNLMFEARDMSRVKVIDFGIARSISEGKGLTMTGMIVGTPGYMSPEQARGVREIDARSDVFSLGCVLFECVTGWRPFSGEHSLAVRTKIVLGTPPPIEAMASEAPAALIALLDRMLAKRPDDRPRDGNEIAAALAALPAIAAGPRRRTSDDEPSTLALHGRRYLDFVVVAAHDATGEPTLLAELERIVTQIDRTAEVAQLESDVVLVRVPGDRDPRSRAEVALRCARAVQQRLPDAPVAIAGISAGVDELDRVVQRLIAAVVASATPPPLLVDDAIRPYLRPDRPIV